MRTSQSVDSPEWKRTAELHNINIQKDLRILRSARYEERTLGSLEVQLVRFGDAERPLTGGIVLAHGYGAGGDDLVPFAEELASRNPRLPEDFVYVFPAAPNSLEHLGYYNARAWWHLDLDRLEKRLRIDGVQALSAETPPGLVESRNAFLGMLAAIETELYLPVSQLVLGGFSQGSMLAADVTWRLPVAPKGLAILSGATICEAEWKVLAAGRSGLPVFQAHGLTDQVLPYPLGDHLRQLLEGAHVKLEFCQDTGGHTISLPTFQRLGTWLESLFAQSDG